VSALKLTAYFGERDRAGDRFLADALIDIYARHKLATSLVMRGVEGFGAKHHRHTDRLLTLSEDLPLVAVAVDTAARIEAVRAEVAALPFAGPLTLERAALTTEPVFDGPTKLTVYLGRHEPPGHEAVVDLLRRHGIAGASVLLGIDGTAHGTRHRGRFLGANRAVPLMVISVGDGDRIAALLPELDTQLARPLVTLERVQIYKRDGERLGEPDGRNKLMVYGGAPLAHELMRRLRRAGAAGATSLRAVWGYHGDHAPHGDTLWQLRRRVGVVTVIVDEPERMGRWFEIVDELTAETGLVTGEIVRSAR
jgi:PII-like signaling protein